MNVSMSKYNYYQRGERHLFWPSFFSNEKEEWQDQERTRAISSPEWSTVSRAMPTSPLGTITSLLTTLTACMR